MSLVSDIIDVEFLGLYGVEEATDHISVSVLLLTVALYSRIL